MRGVGYDGGSRFRQWIRLIKLNNITLATFKDGLCYLICLEILLNGRSKILRNNGIRTLRTLKIVYQTGIKFMLHMG